MIALIVLEQNVVFRLILFYKRAFEDKGFELAGTDNVVKIEHVVHHLLNLGLVALALSEILAHPVFKDLRLTYIYNLFFGVAHYIHAG